jgi:hypothetical protein
MHTPTRLTIRLVLSAAALGLGANMLGKASFTATYGR